VVVHVLGSELGVPTKVAVGYDPHAKRRLESAKKEKSGLEEYLEKTKGGIAALEECIRDGTFTVRRSELYAKLAAIQEHLQSELGRVDTPEVKIHGTVFPNTTICIRNASLLIRDAWRRATFYEHEGEVKVMPLA
jgi:uncharacterized protein (DUF342 family)